MIPRHQEQFLFCDAYKVCDKLLDSFLPTNLGTVNFFGLPFLSVICLLLIVFVSFEKMLLTPIVNKFEE